MQAPQFQIHFCNPGEYRVNLNFSFQSSHHGIQQYSFPQIEQRMPQQQAPAIQFGDARQFTNGYTPFNNGHTYTLPRPESDSSFFDQSYSSEISTPGIASESWSYNSPQQVYPHYMNRDGQRFGSNNDSQQILPSISSGTSFNRGFCPPGKSEQYHVTSTPTKKGCFDFQKKCVII